MDKNFNELKKVLISKWDDLDNKFSFADLIEDLGERELLHVHLLMRFFWVVWRIGCFETEKALDGFRNDYPGFLKSVYIGKQILKLDEFVKGNYVPKEKILINSDASLFDFLQFKKPGPLACFGLCNKYFWNNRKRLMEKYPSIKWGAGNVPMSQKMGGALGGTILINNKGKIIYTYSMKYIGDHINPEEIINSVKVYFGSLLVLKVERTATFIRSQHSNNISNFDHDASEKSNSKNEITDKDIFKFKNLSKLSQNNELSNKTGRSLNSDNILIKIDKDQKDITYSKDDNSENKKNTKFTIDMKKINDEVSSKNNGIFTYTKKTQLQYNHQQSNKTEIDSNNLDIENIAKNQNSSRDKHEAKSIFKKIYERFLKKKSILRVNTIIKNDDQQQNVRIDYNVANNDLSQDNTATGLKKKKTLLFASK